MMFLKQAHKSKRGLYTVYAFIAVVLAFALSDPDLNFIQNLPFGSVTIVMMLQLAKGVLYVVAAHNARKALFDYPEADFQQAAKTALQSPVGAGLVCLALSLAMLAFTMSFVFAPHG